MACTYEATLTGLSPGTYTLHLEPATRTVEADTTTLTVR